MSYSSVCQGLQSCLEPLLIEPRALKLKLTRPGSNLSQPFEWTSSCRNNSSSLSLSDSNSDEKPVTQTPITTTNDEHDMKSEASLSFLQCLSNISHCNKTKEHETENVYVHPSVKFSSSMLGAKSLELCTESLGCETGSSDASANTDDISLFSSGSSSNFTRNNPVFKRNSESKRLNRVNSFPPPLTSITDLGGVQVRSHREDGRLILEAVTSSSPQPYFETERGNGRLRLRMFESVSSYYGDDDEGEVETLNQEACGEEDYGTEEEFEEYVGNAEDEKGMKMFTRPRRCKESGKRDIFGDGFIELTSISLCL